MKGVWGLLRTIIDGHQEYYEISSIYECVEKLLTNIFLELNWFFNDPSRMSEFSWTLCSSAWVVFNKFPLIDATDRIVRLVAITFDNFFT